MMMNLLMTLDQYTINRIYRFVFDQCIKELTPSFTDGCKRYWYDANGQLHRNVGPAYIGENGSVLRREWYQKGQLHRSRDQPAVIVLTEYKNSLWSMSYVDRQWWQNGKVHRDDDQPAIVRTDGTKEWWQHGELHRSGDQPAVIDSDGNQYWWQHGQRHRDENQPAIIEAEGDQYWYQHGTKIRALLKTSNNPILLYQNNRINRANRDR